jgi:hypothetical protein
MSKDKKKNKKEKVKYVDDGRTLYDMSALGGGNRGLHVGNGTMKDQARTYFAAVRQMIIPMFITIGIICVAFGLLWLLLTLAEMGAA